MGARAQAKAEASIQDIRKEFPQADIHFLEMDLTRLESVVAAAAELRRYVCSLPYYLHLR